MYPHTIHISRSHIKHAAPISRFFTGRNPYRLSAWLPWQHFFKHKRNRLFTIVVYRFANEVAIFKTNIL
jgi:hypothetical protein